jgi:hypothetical protein
MGTRAVIRVDGKPVFATHWDGYPESLGADLVGLRKKTLASVQVVARKHSVDFASPIVRKGLNEERVRYIAKKHKLPIEKVKKGYRRGNIITSDDYEIGGIRGYDDWAEYEYDVNTKTGKVMVRPRAGSYEKDNIVGKWFDITKGKLKKDLIKKEDARLWKIYESRNPKLKKMLEKVT